MTSIITATVCTCDIETSTFCNNCICDHEMVYGMEGYLAESLPFNPDADTDAQQEALTDDTCYCDDVDICPPCMRYLAMVEFVVDTTPSVALTPEQQAAFDNLPW